MPTLPDTAPALVVTTHGGRDVLAVQDRPVPAPGPGEALVAVTAVGVNYIDVYQREGVYPLETPFVAACEGAGEVVSVGADVTDLVVGDRVAWARTAPGSAASYAVLPAESLVQVPPEVPFEDAAAVALQGMTAHFLSRSCFPVSTGTVALVHAAAGGVGQLLVQMLKQRGARVIATAGSAAKCVKAADRGADVTIDYSAVDDLAAAVTDANDGQGVDVVYDGVGKATFDASLSSLRPRGLMVLFGAASGVVPPFDIQRLNAGGSLFLTRPSLPHYIATTDELRARARDVFHALTTSGLQVEIGGRFPFSRAADAYAALESRESQGKLLLLPDRA